MFKLFPWVYNYKKKICSIDFVKVLLLFSIFMIYTARKSQISIVTSQNDHVNRYFIKIKNTFICMKKTIRKSRTKQDKNICLQKYILFCFKFTFPSIFTGLCILLDFSGNLNYLWSKFFLIGKTWKHYLTVKRFEIHNVINDYKKN